MKTMGILTFWNVPNYGAFMQAYALQKVLQERYKYYEVKQIPYLDSKHYEIYYSKSIRQKFKHWLINPRFYKELLKQRDRAKQIESSKKFLEYYKSIPNFKNILGKDIKKIKLDVLVLGSDIIWDYTVPFFGNDGYLFGYGIDAKNKISYAPGCGSVKEGDVAPEYVIKGLSELVAISVRDEKTARIVKNLTGRNAEVVLDPTLLLDFNTDSNIIKPRSENYVIVYGSFFTENLIQGAKEYVKRHKLKLICLSSLDDKFDWCDQVINQEELNPFEWVGYFKYADAVMTCTYHGLLFSIIFHKKIVFNMTEFIWDKAESFVKKMGLEKVLADMESFDEKISWEWNYEEIDRKLGEMKKRSFDFIESAVYDE